MVSEQLVLFLFVAGTDFSSVASVLVALLPLLVIACDEGCPHTGDLFGGGGAHIIGTGDASETARGGKSLQSRNPCANHKHPCGFDRPRRRHHHGQQAWVVLGGFQNRPIARKIALGGQHIHALSPCDARQTLQSKQLQRFLSCHRKGIIRCCREQADDDCPISHGSQICDGWRRKSHDDVGVFQPLTGIGE